ncbi:hypothetical protein [Streptomyces californicus]|uniref:hypothetical protein n=1 Tax=Streptomyces californicus TaxID=67351 RepID=UPI003712A88D
MRSRTRPDSAPRHRGTALLALPITLAIRIFRPSGRNQFADHTVEFVHMLRSGIGLAATCWLIWSYPMRESAASLVAERLSDTFATAGVLLVAGPLVVMGFIASSRPPVRTVYWRRLGGPIGGVASLFASALTLWLLLKDDGGIRLTQMLGPLQFVGLIAVLAAVLFATVFGLTAVVLSVHYVFRTGDIHQVLPPALSSLLAWLTLLVQTTDEVAAPAGVQLLFLYGAPLSITLLSGWELQRLHTRFGVTVRRALGR